VEQVHLVKVLLEQHQLAEVVHKAAAEVVVLVQLAVLTQGKLVALEEVAEQLL
jgi:hypothetical protein